MFPKKIQLTPQGPGDFCSVRDDPGSPLGAASVFVVLLLPLLLGPVPVALLLISVRWNKVSPTTCFAFQVLFPFFPVLPLKKPVGEKPHHLPCSPHRHLCRHLLRQHAGCRDVL